MRAQDSYFITGIDATTSVSVTGLLFADDHRPADKGFAFFFFNLSSPDKSIKMFIKRANSIIMKKT